jgi:large repetitive protein
MLLLNLFTLLPLLALLACRSEEKSREVNEEEIITDKDGDGFLTTDGDCDDNNDQINPGAEEICDGIDNDCDDSVDENVLQTYYLDADTDGYGDPNTTEEACNTPEGHSPFATDCNDQDPSVYPSAEEICDGLDNDCDETIDEDVLETYFLDADQDGFGDDNQIIEGCNPTLTLSDIGGDCNDEDPAISPVASEVCDMIDNNCDGVTDDDAVDTRIWYADADNDGFGDESVSLIHCTQPNAYVDNNSDCNDEVSQWYPNAPEVCDGFDNDCDGTSDENDAVDANIYYADTDGDGFGDIAYPMTSCELPAGHADNGEDCDDGNNAVHPNAEEICDGIDNDCNNGTDIDTTDASTWFIDADGDGFGSNAYIQITCTQPTGFVNNDTDCDDLTIVVSPSATEVCDGLDNDCDGDVDDDDSSLDSNTLNTFYVDVDGDGFGTNTTVQACTPTTGQVLQLGDCDDTNPTISPNATEVCDFIDNNCDGNVDDEDATLDTTSGTIYYLDGDGDGFGDDNTSVQSCLAPTSAYILTAGDCNDNSVDINPNADELCNAIDDNCNGTLDDNAIDGLTWYIDGDNDGFGSSSSTQEDCDQPQGFIDNTDDCDDGDGNVQFCATCQDILDLDISSLSGVYALDPCGVGTATDYYCDMDTELGGWTVGGWQLANGSLILGNEISGSAGDASWSADLSCMPFEEIMVFNQDNGDYFTQNYGSSEWMINFLQSGANIAYGSVGNAFKLGYYGGSTAMGCVDYWYGGMYVQYACDSDGSGGAKGHLASYAGEYCSGGRLDGTWAWSNGSTCSMRGVNYTWGIGIR